MLRLRRFAGILGLLAVSCTIGCGAGSEERSVAGSAKAESAPLPVAGATGPRVVILGDSLTAGLGLPIAEAYPSLLQRRIADEGLNYTIVNAGVSGDTTAGGLSRLDWALTGDVRVLVLALGGNDGLRGLPIAELRRNLSEIIERAQARSVAVVLAGMEAPPNYGFDYTVAFHKMYPELAKKYRIAFVPFLLERVGGNLDLNQPDGIHPNTEGAKLVADNVWSVLKPVIESDATRVERGKAPDR
jgi:acyl-CoA thioesterase-1